MSAGLEHIRQHMADFLNKRGVKAVAAWPMSPKTAQEEPVVAVSLRGCKAGPVGFQNYLGDRYDEEKGKWEERYGRKAELTFGLDIYAQEKGDGEAVQAALDEVKQSRVRFRTTSAAEMQEQRQKLEKQSGEGEN